MEKPYKTSITWTSNSAGSIKWTSGFILLNRTLRGVIIPLKGDGELTGASWKNNAWLEWPSRFPNQLALKATDKIPKDFDP